MTTAPQVHKGKAGGLALAQKYGREHMRSIGCLGGRPLAPTMDSAMGSVAPAAQKVRKEPRRRESLKELLGLWEIKQAQAGNPGEGCCLQPAPVLLKAAGGKPGPGLPSRFSPRPVCCPGRNRGTGGLHLKTRAKRLPFFCQCRDCLETFSVDGLAINGKLVELEDLNRIGHNGNGDYFHRCGGDGHFKGMLKLYPTLNWEGGEK